MRRLVGDRMLNYLGTSYGTEVGAISAGSPVATEKKFTELLARMPVHATAGQMMLARMPVHATAGQMSYAQVISGTIHDLYFTSNLLSSWSIARSSCSSCGSTAVAAPA